MSPLLILLLCIGLPVATCAKQPIPYMVGYTTKDSLSDAQTIAAWLGRPMDILGTTITMTAYWISIPSPFQISVACPMLSISSWDNLQATDMNQAATGAYDTHYQSMANSLAAAGGKLYAVRLGWEMNGDWYPWSVGNKDGGNQTWANYIATFRRMANIFRKTVPGVQIEFCANWQYQYNRSGTLDQYWPGDEYVDIVSLDIYQKNLGNGNGWSYAQTGGTWNLNWLVNFTKAHGKKMALSEWGAYNDDGTYISDAINWMNNHSDQFAYSVYSQYDPADQVVANGTNLNEQVAWIRGWGNTYYSPRNSTGNSSTGSPANLTQASSAVATMGNVFVVFVLAFSALCQKA